MSPKIFTAIFLLLVGVQMPVEADEPQDRRQRIHQAIERGTAVLRKGVENYPNNRQCFSCHHQALPLLALSSQHNSRNGELNQAFYGNELTKSVCDFTTTSFENKLSSLRAGSNVGGRALTVAYGLWTLDLAGAKRSEVTDAMVESLLKTQAEDGAWDFQSHRPPAASSRAMTTAIAVYGLSVYGPQAEKSRLKSAFSRANEWLKKTNLPKDHEDLVGMLWLEYLLRPLNFHGTGPQLESNASRLASSQRRDGSWAQSAERDGDAYATSQALLITMQTETSKFSLLRESDFVQGVNYLLRNQQPDGSWHVVTHSKPVQVYFDNGDPHGKDQFISMMATSWAVAALAAIEANARHPLDSTRTGGRDIVHLFEIEARAEDESTP